MLDLSNCRCIIFDLDGTLWDATEVTAETWVEVLKNHPEVKPKLPLDIHTIKKYMGLTNEELAGVFFPDLPYEKAFAMMNASCDLENKWLPERGGRLYPHVRETLVKLCEMGERLFIVSNCQDGYIEAFLTAHKMYDVIKDWESSGRSGKSKGENIKDIISRNSLTSAVYVGDTVSDSVGARFAGIPFIYAKYGFGEENGRGKTDDYDESISDISELCEIIAKILPKF